MKRYLLFAFNTYYPSGGHGDFVGDFDTIAEAAQVQSAKSYDFREVLDTSRGGWIDIDNWERVQ